MNDDRFMYDLPQVSTAQTKNNFAEAYIQPEWKALDQFDTPDIPGRTSAKAEDLNQYRGTAAAGSETRLFWTVYASTAFEGSTDGDPNDEPDTPLGLTDAGGNASLVFKETSRDIGRRNPELELPLIMAHEIGHQFGLAAEMAPGPYGPHRDKPVNLMSGVALEASVDDQFFRYEYIRLHPIDIAKIRRNVNSPGT